jgi:hypothetical protein
MVTVVYDLIILNKKKDKYTAWVFPPQALHEQA